MAEAPSFGPSTSVRTTPASFDTTSLRHDINEGFNAYDFAASYDGSMLTLVLTEDEMRSMDEAGKPHRNRTITVGICPNEPHHISQACGDPIWQGSMRLADRLELPAIPLASCNGWIVVNAAEMSDDRYDGWRNAPCPVPDGGPVGSDGTGDVWPDYSEYDPNDPRANYDPTLPAPPWYDNMLYGELVYDEFEGPAESRSYVLPNLERFRVVFQLQDPGGNCHIDPNTQRVQVPPGSRNYDTWASLASVL